MSPDLASSFLSFPTQAQSQSSPRLSIHRNTDYTQTTQTQNSPSSSTSTPFRHLSYPHQRRRPAPIDLYALPTLEALPTPVSSSSQSQLSSIDQTLDRPRRLKKPPSQGDLSGRIMRSFTKKKSGKDKEKKKEKDKKSHNDTSFLPFDTDPPYSALSSGSRRPSSPSVLPRPPAGMSSRSKPRPPPLDPTIFGHRVHVVKAEDPIDMVLRLDSEARVQAITRSFSPFGSEQQPPRRPPPLDPSVFGNRGIKVVRAEDPIDMVLRLDEEAKRQAMTQSFTPFGDKQSTSWSRGQSVGQPQTATRTAESRAGSVRQRHHGAMPSIQGVIEGVEVRTDRERRESFKLPMMAPPPSSGNNLQRSPTSASRHGTRAQINRAPSPTASPPREYFYTRPESPRVHKPVIPGFTNRSPPSHNAIIDESPTLGSIHLPVVTRQQSLSPSATHSDRAWHSSPVEYEEERLTALEILEELNGGMEDGWEFGVLDSQRIQAGLDDRNFKQFGLATVHSPHTSVISVGHHKDSSGSIKEAANSIRSWREYRKKNKDGRSISEKSFKSNSKTGSLKPKPSYDAMKPLYEVHYSMEKDVTPPPIPPRAPGRSLPPLKLHIERITTGGSGSSADIPIVLDSPVKATGMRESMDTIRRHDIPESVILSPPTSPTPIHQRPLPPVPHASPHSKSQKGGTSLASLKQADSITRLLRNKRPNGSPSLLAHGHHSSPPAFMAPLSPLDSPPPSSPRPRLSARDEPHASLPPRRDQSFSINRAESRKHGMTALSFLALEDPVPTWAHATSGERESLDEVRRRQSVQAHIIPPEELAKLVTRRRDSSDSGRSRTSEVPDYYTEELAEDGDADKRAGRMSFGLSPPPRHNRRSFEPPPRVDEEEVLPNSLSPPPRPRHSLSSRPSDSPSTTTQNRYDHLCPSPAPSPFTATPSPTHTYARSQLSTPSPVKASADRDLVGNAHGHSPASTMGHAEELRQGSSDSISFKSASSPQKEMDKQALNEWLSKPRIRKASVPVQGISRRRGMLV